MCESGRRPGLCWRIRAVRQVNPLHYSTLKKRLVIDVLSETTEVFTGHYAQQLSSQHWQCIQCISMIKA